LDHRLRGGGLDEPRKQPQEGMLHTDTGADRDAPAGIDRALVEPRGNPRMGGMRPVQIMSQPTGQPRMGRSGWEAVVRTTAPRKGVVGTAGPLRTAIAGIDRDFDSPRRGTAAGFTGTAGTTDARTG